jgi:hypothetical protein
MFGLLLQSIILCYVFILVFLSIKFYFSYLYCCYEVCSVTITVSGLIL